MTDYKLVPVEPTLEMYEAGESTFQSSYTGTPTSEPGAVYRAMLAAAPSPAWIKVSERLPTREDADEFDDLWWFGKRDGKLRVYLAQYPRSSFETLGATHWMPKPRVQPPSPPEGE